MVADSSPAFVSYSRADGEFALKLAEDLKAGAANVWLDQLDIEPGERWARAVQAALNSAPCVLVILSRASVNSTNVEDEVAFALEKRKKVIPIFYQDCEVPFQLVPFQYVDFRLDYARGLGRLLKTLAVSSVQAVSAFTASAATVPDGIPIGAERLAEDREQSAAEKAYGEEQEQQRKASEEKARHHELELQDLATERAKHEEEDRKAAAQKARLQEEERQRKAAEEKTRLDELERQGLAAERAKHEEEDRKAAAQKARLEEEGRQRKAAEEKTRLDELERQRVIAESTRIIEERRQQNDDEIDALWEAERQKRDKELTKAIVEEWSARGRVSLQGEEGEAVGKLRSHLNDWLAQRPPGFETREERRQAQEKAETKKALDNWRLRR